jgi:hypothetical protein
MGRSSLGISPKHGEHLDDIGLGYGWIREVNLGDMYETGVFDMMKPARPG